MKTLLLDQTLWDLVLDVSGNIAVAENPYAMAQDAASACRCFLEEQWYNTDLGINYFSLLGKSPNFPLLRTKMAVQVKLTVPGVVSAKVFFTAFVDRRVAGQVQVTDKDGNVTAAAF